jgi:hypothetical protein
MREQTQRDATLRFQCGEWLRERSIGKVIRWVLGRRRGLLRGRLRLPLSLGKRQQIVGHDLWCWAALLRFLLSAAT